MVRTPSLRLLITALAVVPALILAAALVTLQAVSTREISERLGQSLIDSATSHVRTDVTAFLSDAVTLSNLYDRRIRAGILPTSGLSHWERAELDDLVVNPGIASISFGAATGETTWLLRRADRLELGRVTPRAEASEFSIDPGTGVVDPAPLRTYSYDPRERPWYRTAVHGDAPVWTPVYFWFGDAGADSETGAGFVRPVKRADGALAGVLVIDVTLGGLSTFLSSLQFSSSGSIFLVDSAGLLVAASHGAVNSPEGERLSLANSGHPAAAAVAAAIGGGGAYTTSAESTFRVTSGGLPARARITPLRPFPGIEWNVIAVIPESAFLAEAHSLQRRAFMLSAAAVLGALVLAFLLSRRMCRPFLALADHVRRVGEGDFTSRLHLRAARELRDLSEELNRTTLALKDRMELQQSLALAMQVQQSLLPSGPPTISGLDIAGQSRYCDATGGDYYDFIEISDLPGGLMLIAVGDVMGHGIAAALLMATARAALRAHAWRHGSLGELMDRVNAVLAADTRHGRFMTMILVVVDPVEGVARWSSAGHDPPIIFDASSHGFLDIEGGDLPLGLMPDTTYKEYTIHGLSPGAVIVIGTDGIWEAASPDGELFGKDRLRDIIRDAPHLPSDALLKKIEATLAEFCGVRRPEDDITMVVVRVQPTPAPGQPQGKSVEAQSVAG